MSYFFVKEYNSSYDIFLIRYFREGGIEFSDNTPFNEADHRELFSVGMKSMTPYEKLFSRYVVTWRSHPECRPAFYYLLDKALGGTGRPDINKLKELQSQLPQHQKLLFTKEDVATDISKFYRKYLRIPLKQELEKGGVGVELYKYFSPKEGEHLPYAADVGEESFEREVNKTAGELLTALGEISREKIVSDLDNVLEDHEWKPNHMSLMRTISVENRNQWNCRHKSEHVELSVFQEVDPGPASMFLKPARGLDIAEDIVGTGWDSVVFPRYYVVKES